MNINNNYIKKNLLAVDCSTELSSISLLYNNNLYSKYIYNKLKKYNYILIMLNELIKKNNINLKKISILLINNGPGSILGIRISNVISKIFKIKFKKLKIIKLTSFEIIKEGFFKKKKKEQTINIVIYNNINCIYWSKFNEKKNIIKKKINLKKFHKIIKKIPNNKKIIVNSYKLKKKIKFILKKKNINIKVCYPKSIDMISIFNKKLTLS